MKLGYRELIKKVKVYSGFSEKESEKALESTVKCLAARLPESERKEFARELPGQLHDKALSVHTSRNDEQELLDQIVVARRISAIQARKQLLCTWEALKTVMNPRRAQSIRLKLPLKSAVLLH